MLIRIFHSFLNRNIKIIIEKIHRKKLEWFSEKSIHNINLTIHWIIKVVHAINHEATLLFVDFSKAFDSIHRGKMEQILLAYGLPKETVTVIMILYKKHKSKGLLIWWRHRLLRHCCWCFARRYISIISG